jgi:hypothetical protein
LAALLVGWKVAQWIAAGDNSLLLYTAIGTAVLAITVVILNNWRVGCYGLIAWLLFEDIIRKYMGNNMTIYFAKDALAATVYFSFWTSLQRKREVLFKPPFFVPFGFFFFLGLVQCFNPNSPSLLYGLLGFKLYFYYVPLMFIGYSMIRCDEDLRRFFLFSMGLAIVISVLGIAQAIIGPSFLNPATLAPDIRDLSTLYRVAPITGAILYRPTSVFVSDGRFASYLLLAWVMGLGAAGFILLRRARGQVVIYLGTAMAIVAAVFSGGRGMFAQAVLSALVLAACFLWGAPWRQRLSHRMIKAIWRTGVIAAAAIVLAVALFPEQVGARWDFYSETMNPESQDSEVQGRMETYPVSEFMKAFDYPNWALGYGIGTASLGVQYVSRWLGQRPPSLGVESGFGTLVLEYGVAGPILWLIWTATLLFTGAKTVLRVKQTAYFPIACAIWWFAFSLLVMMTYGTMVMYQNYVYNAYFWLLVGILFRLPALASSSSTVYSVAAADLQ